MSTYLVTREDNLLNEDMPLRKGMVFSGWHVKTLVGSTSHKSLITKLAFVFLC